LIADRGPYSDELEISVFGSGYGESIAIHYGQSRWLVVDSCRRGRTGQPAATTYLQSLGVPEDGVRLIAATHWHDDHIAGLSDVVHAYPQARFACSAALQEQEFLTLIAVFEEGSRGLASGMTSGVRELYSILDTLTERGDRPRWAIENRCLFHDTYADSDGAPVNVSVHSLSPGDEAVQRALLHVGQLLPRDNEPTRRVPDSQPNHSSVVLWVALGDDVALLGADMETTGEANTGWEQVHQSDARPLGVASVFKVPHHGSENGFHQGIWDDLIVTGPVAIVTPHNRLASPLPTPEEVTRITNLAPRSYATATHRRRTPSYERTVQKTLREMGKRLEIIHPSFGQVRLRRQLNAPDWSVELGMDAVPLADIAS